MSEGRLATWVGALTFTLTATGAFVFNSFAQDLSQSGRIIKLETIVDANARTLEQLVAGLREVSKAIPLIAANAQNIGELTVQVKTLNDSVIRLAATVEQKSKDGK